MPLARVGNQSHTRAHLGLTRACEECHSHTRQPLSHAHLLFWVTGKCFGFVSGVFLGLGNQFYMENRNKYASFWNQKIIPVNENDPDARPRENRTRARVTEQLITCARVTNTRACVGSAHHTRGRDTTRANTVFELVLLFLYVFWNLQSPKIDFSQTWFNTLKIKMTQS